MKKGFDLGLLAFAGFQTSREESSPRGTDTSEYAVYRIGPEIDRRLKWLTGFPVKLRAG